MKLSTYIKSNSIKIISILLCLTIFLMLFGVGCSAKKDGDIEVQATITNIERGYDKFERKKYERHFVTYTANGKTYTSILNGDVSDSIIFLSGIFLPIRCFCPEISSSVCGRILSANGLFISLNLQYHFCMRKQPQYKTCGCLLI